jgi:receptor protein-tyrosine kinase
VALAAGVLSVLLCVMLELLDKSLKTRQDFEKASRLPVIGEIPYVNGRKNVVTRDAPGSAAAESFRGLRTMLSLSAAAKDAKLIAITSPMPREGKSFISLNLAASCAQAGKRVLLVDSDLRHRALTEQLCRENSARQGLSSILAGALGASSYGDLVVKPFDGLSLDFMPSGSATQNPSELLASENTRNTFEDFARNYDVVIVDTAPVLAFSDTPILSAVPSMNFLMVGRLYETEKRQMAEAVKTLRSVNGPLIGTVVELGEKDAPTGSGYVSETAQDTKRPWYKKLLRCA